MRKCVLIEIYVFVKSLPFKEIVVLLSEMTKMLKNEGMKQGEFTENYKCKKKFYTFHLQISLLEVGKKQN